MNSIVFQLKTLKAGESICKDGLKFINVSLIELIVDRKPTSSLPFLNDSLIVFSELIRSLNGDGLYLIFTCACGAADDAGWDGVNITYHDRLVSWSFDYDNIDYYYEFDLNEYRDEINRLQKEIEELPIGSEIEPVSVIFPESWE